MGSGSPATRYSSRRLMRAPRRRPLDDGAEGSEGARVGGEVGVRKLGAADASGVLTLLVHADRPVHAVVDHEHEDRKLVLHGGCELLAAHQEVAVAGEADHGAGW